MEKDLKEMQEKMENLKLDMEDLLKKIAKGKSHDEIVLDFSKECQNWNSKARELFELQKKIELEMKGA